MVQRPGGGSGRDLPAGPFSTPRFLAAQRSAGSSLREEIAVVALAAQHNTRVCGPLCDPSSSSQAIPSLSGASTVLVSTLVLDCNCKPVCSSFNDQTAGQRTYSLSPPQGIFALQKSLRGDCPRKEISRGNLLCAKSGLPNLSYSRRLSAQKYVTTPDWKNFYTGQPRGARGTAVPLFREASRGTPSKRFLWATSSRRLDTALLFADKKRGVETIRLAGYCQSTPGPWTTGPAKKPPAAALGSKKPPLRAGSKTKTPRGVLPAKGSTIWQNFCPSAKKI